MSVHYLRYAAAMTLMTGSLTVPGRNWKVSKTFPIGGEGSWDYVTVDSAAHRLFVPRSSHTMVIDGASGKVLGDISRQQIAHDVALVLQLNRGFINDYLRDLSAELQPPPLRFPARRIREHRTMGSGPFECGGADHESIKYRRESSALFVVGGCVRRE